MSINIWSVVAATVAMFAVGGIWYMALFSRVWGKIVGLDKMTKKQREEMSKGMGVLYGMQIVVTVLSAAMLAYFMGQVDIAWYMLAFFLWLGFIVPTEVSAVIFGGTDTKMALPKIMISIGGSLASTLVGAWVISLF
jgi:hypothetical protein